MSKLRDVVEESASRVVELVLFVEHVADSFCVDETVALAVASLLNVLEIDLL